MIDDDDDVNDDVVVMISWCERKGRRVMMRKETKSGTIVSDEAPLVWLAGCEKDDDDDADEYCHRCFEKITKPLLPSSSSANTATSKSTAPSIAVDWPRLSITVRAASVSPLKLVKTLKRAIQRAIHSTTCPIGSPYARTQN